MTGKLDIICCRILHAAVAAAVADEGWADVHVAAFPASCGCRPARWEDLRPLVEDGCTQVVIIGGDNGLDGMGYPAADWPPVRLLLEIGTVQDPPLTPDELVKAVGMPVVRLAVGIENVRHQLGRIVAEWRLEEERRQATARDRDYAGELADHKSAMDFLGRVSSLKEEQETIAVIEEMFTMLFAPQEFHYVRFENGAAIANNVLSADLSRQVQSLTGDWAWTDAGTGFLLRIAKAGEVLGIVVADRFACPEYCDRYLNLALSIVNVACLAIDNARTYRRIKETDDALRKSERSLKMAQAIAHLGHWELDVETREVRWSDETYRILGYEPGQFTPSYETFFKTIHPDDRELVAGLIDKVDVGRGFDIEFKVVLPNGRIRVLHGVGEGICFGEQMQSQIIGAIRDITGPERSELLGVIQDITDRKELQRKLEQEAHTDPLTGCANRRYFLKLAEYEIARARRYDGDVSVLMLDLDHFKAINDRYGHHVGDLVLQKLVKVCQEILRSEDVFGRLGGEEFAILLPETGSRKAVDVADRLCLAVADSEVSLEGTPPIHFTTSIGAATLAPEDHGIDEVLDRADQALYKAKSAGRNQVVAA